MIILTPLRELPLEYLEYKGIKQVIIYNLSSYYDAPRLNFLLPSPEYIPEDQLTGDCNTPNFDMAYHNFIITNNNAFKQFMELVIPANQSPDILIYIMIKHSPYCDAISESLMKLIQQRYGYNVYFINEPDDFLYVDEPTFSIPGLFTYDKDLLRYQSLSPESMNFGDEY